MVAIRSLLFFSVLLILSNSGCNEKPQDKVNRIVIGIPSDAESLNPLFSFSGSESSITELLYLSLVNHKWDEEKGELATYPMLAEKWEWSSDSSSVIVYLRDNVYWTDGKKITADDIVFSFDLYSDPEVQSRFYGTFENFYTNDELHIDLEKTFQIKNPLVVAINFKEYASPMIVDIDMPIIPKHIFEKLERKNFITSEKGLDSVVSGPFKLGRWDKNQVIVLEANRKCFLHNESFVDEIIFKIIPDYNSRITQLKNGEIDLSEDLKTEDAEELKNFEHVQIASVKGREYDYIGWNNVQPLSNGKKHNLFGSPEIRKALTYAINRAEILEEFLGNYGSLAAGPVAPIFKDVLNTQIKPLAFNIQKAKEILSAEEWNDADQDGVLEKKGTEFSFTLFIASGNPRREFASTLIKNNLKAVGINVKVEALEPGVFVEKLFNREFDAWMAGWTIPIPLDLKPYWHSDINENPMNFTGYKNPDADIYLEKIDVESSSLKRNMMIKEFQEILFEDNPVTFLYWIDNIIGYNKRIGNINISPLGALHNCWEWTVK
jgi:peptide/nickel transport system substrate-binding protein